MVRRRAFSGQGQKCIPMCKSPLDNLFHGIDAEAFDIMLQDNGDIMLLNPGDDILNDNGCIGCFAGITAGDIPVKILISHIREVFGQFGHNTGAVAFADGIGTSAGKTDKGCPDAGGIFNGILLFCVDRQKSILTGIDFGIIMCSTVNANGMTGVCFGF